MPPFPVLTVVGSRPTGVEGVSWRVRKNPARAQLNFTEVAVVELLSLFPHGAEADWSQVVERVAELKERRTIRLERITKVVATERRKPDLRRNFKRLQATLAA